MNIRQAVFGNEFVAQQLIDLDRYELIVKLLEDGTNKAPFRAKTLPPHWKTVLAVGKTHRPLPRALRDPEIGRGDKAESMDERRVRSRSETAPCDVNAVKTSLRHAKSTAYDLSGVVRLQNTTQVCPKVRNTDGCYYVQASRQWLLQRRSLDNPDGLSQVRNSTTARGPSGRNGVDSWERLCQ